MDQIKEAKEVIKKLTNCVISYKEKVDQLNIELREKIADFESKLAEKDQIQTQNIADITDQLSKEKNNLEAELLSTKEALSTEITKNTELANQTETLQKSIDELESEKSELNNSISELTDENIKLKEEITKLKEKANIKREVTRSIPERDAELDALMAAGIALAEEE